MRDTLLVVNAGSSSIKFALFEGRALIRSISGSIDGISSKPHFRARAGNGAQLAEREFASNKSQSELFEELLTWIQSQLGNDRLRGVGHRIVHGGERYSAPVLLTQAVVEDLRATIPLAPLHEPHNLAPVATLAALYPTLPQVGCFDTAFHLSNPRISRLYALPHALSDAGVMRYGFHGLSYEYIAGELPRLDARAASGRTLIAHLGSGASLCALVNSKSVASSMGFSALDGLPMGTRCGAIDPGVLLYLLQEQELDAAQLTDLLYHQSGLLGVSGLSADMRELLASAAPRAQEAVALFAYRTAREIGSLLSAAGGIDALVFTAGIGERSGAIRARICQHLAWLGLRIDTAANAANATRISTDDSAISAWVVPTNEELMIARHTQQVVGAQAQTTSSQ